MHIQQWPVCLEMNVLCSAQQISNEVLQPASITLTGDLSCAEHKFLSRVEQNIEAKVNDKVSAIASIASLTPRKLVPLIATRILFLCGAVLLSVELQPAIVCAQVISLDPP